MSATPFLRAATVGLVVLAAATTVAVVMSPSTEDLTAARSASVTSESVIANAGEPVAVAPVVEGEDPATGEPAAADPGAGVATNPVGSLGIPATVLAAYHRGEAWNVAATPGCGITWSLLAGIGKVESDHAAGGVVDPATGTTTGSIRGRVLDGTVGVAIPDTDGGRLDGDAQWDRAVGPMQFIPSTWTAHATDGNADGVASPDNVYDAATTAGRYLCARGADLTTRDGQAVALMRYNRSAVYGQLVLRWADAYAGGATAVADDPGGVAAVAELRLAVETRQAAVQVDGVQAGAIPAGPVGGGAAVVGDTPGPAVAGAPVVASSTTGVTVTTAPVPAVSATPTPAPTSATVTPTVMPSPTTTVPSLVPSTATTTTTVRPLAASVTGCAGPVTTATTPPVPPSDVERALCP
ncbi:lytic transglycosylase domain-containing protein [Pseudonocardia sp. WMMC193]|uniref:lytic transglycosylase domain-containing protein n=1 Tax=Pseudonocardia sp. WMMC193 TaxID=2911965 RepID=UPI001F27BA61|nr:hypothetical protein [Pseudonocardia sp. WMMC193]MCF7553836.1 hypothetical protein [Pseudonocardia sp. WMMC193]